MELKEVVLSTLAELDEGSVEEELIEESIEKQEKILEEKALEIAQNDASQRVFYTNLKERILVLFEGFQSPNNKNIESKVELTLNFLEYLLASIDEQLEKMDTPK